MIKKLKGYFLAILNRFKSWRYFHQFIFGASLILFAAVIFHFIPLTIRVTQDRHDTFDARILDSSVDIHGPVEVYSISGICH